MNILVKWLDLGTIVDMFIFRNSADRTRLVYISHGFKFIAKLSPVKEKLFKKT